MPLEFSPPLLNSASLWATTFEDLQSLYFSPATGAVTTRTCLLNGFADDPSIHQHCLVSTSDPSNPNLSTSRNRDDQEPLFPRDAASTVTSLNTYGYSPHSLSQYLIWASKLVLESIAANLNAKGPRIKPVIISVTGTPSEIAECYTQINQTAYHLLADSRNLSYPTEPSSPFLLMEINLSCPNIANTPPPAYDPAQLRQYLHSIQSARLSTNADPPPTTNILVGIKTPPYTYAAQFTNLISVFLDSTKASTSTITSSSSISPISSTIAPISFITATNTLGSSLLLTPTFTLDNPTPNSTSTSTSTLNRKLETEQQQQQQQAHRSTLSNASGTGIGGLAGASLHPLALGNVATLRRMLDEHEALRGVEVIGVGGVSDRAGYERMRSVGAAAVGVATALGAGGVEIFGRILGEGKGV